MNPQLQRRVQRYGWDRATDHYARLWGTQVRPAQQLLLEMAALQPGQHVLDTACGDGLVSFPAAREVGPEGRVVGTDLSGGMVEAATALARQNGANNTRFARMDAEQLDLQDASFDAALCALGLMYFPDPVQALREMRRVLKPGGTAVCAVWGDRSRCGWAEIFPIVDARVESDVCPLFFQLGSGDNLASAFAAAGFSDVGTRRVETALAYASAAEACAAAFDGGPVALACSRFDDTTRDEAHAEYIASIDPFRDADGGYRIPGEFVVTSGRNPGFP